MKCLAATVCISKETAEGIAGCARGGLFCGWTLCEKKHGFMAPIGRPRWLC